MSEKTEYQSEHERKLAIVALLFKLAATDGEEAVEEQLFIHDMGTRMGLKSDEIAFIGKRRNEYSVSPPSTEPERMTIFYQLLFLMKVDQEADENEIRFLQKVAFRLGLRPQLSEELIRLVIDNVGRQVPTKEMLASIRKFLN